MHHKVANYYEILREERLSYIAPRVFHSSGDAHLIAGTVSLLFIKIHIIVVVLPPSKQSYKLRRVLIRNAKHDAVEQLAQHLSSNILSFPVSFYYAPILLGDCFALKIFNMWQHSFGTAAPGLTLQHINSL